MPPVDIDKKQIAIIGFALLAGLIAAVLVGQFITAQISAETEKLSREYEMARKQTEQQHNEQMAALNQKIQQVEANAKKAAEEAARLAAERAKPKAEAPVKKAKPSLALRTPPGKRAITIKIDSLGAVGGLINPGDYVDVIAHLNVPVPSEDPNKKEDKKESVTAMIFQNIKILAINTNIEDMGAYDDQQKEAALKITVAVNPDEASLLAFAEKNGKFELTLRGQNESKRQMISAATWSTLAEYVLQQQGADIHAPVAKEEVPEAPVEEKPSIQVYRGGKAE